MKTKAHYTNSDLTRFAIEDQLRDIEHSGRRIASGELLPEAIAAELAYIEECRGRIKALSLYGDRKPAEIDQILSK